MPSILWTGKLSPSIKLLVNTSNILSWFTGNARDTKAMKQRVKLGYDGAVTHHITQYDKLGLEFQVKAAKVQLDGLDVKGKEILDIGAGTGAISFLSLERGAKKVICGDISEYMLNQCRKKATDKGYDDNRIGFQLLDAENLPFENNSFDIVMTGMTLGLIPDQMKAIEEMARVTRHGGIVSVGAHGPEHYWEPTDAHLKAMSKRYVVGYRLEFWPRTEKEVRKMMEKVGLSDIQTKRIIWRNRFATGGDAYDFFAAISSSWWYVKFPKEKRQKDYQHVRDYFNRKNKNIVTDDIIIACGHKS